MHRRQRPGDARSSSIVNQFQYHGMHTIHFLFDCRNFTDLWLNKIFFQVAIHKQFRAKEQAGYLQDSQR